MGRRVVISETQIQRAVRGVQRCGLPVTGVEVTTEGTIRVLSAVDRASESPQDDRKPIQWT